MMYLGKNYIVDFSMILNILYCLKLVLFVSGEIVYECYILL